MAVNIFSLLLFSLFIQYTDQGIAFITDIPQRVQIYMDAIGGTMALIRRHGYAAETHTTETSDGYLLTMQRIPHRHGFTGQDGTPVLILPGLACDPNTYVAVNDSIAYYLVDHGYDVWLGNHRGNWRYSEHIKHPIVSEAFWDFTWDEMGNFDIPAKIEHIKEHTGYDKLILVSYSMSSAAAVAFLASQPKYNPRVLKHIALGPVAIGHYQTSVLITLIAPFYPIMKFAFDITINKGWPNYFAFVVLSYVGPAVCLTFLEKICVTTFNYFLGYTPTYYGPRVAMTVSDVTGGSSFKCFLHLLQQIVYPGMRRYNYGRNKNLAKYGTAEPPHFNISSITTPSHFVVGANDPGASPINVELVAREIEGSTTHVLDDRMFNHADFVWSTNLTLRQHFNDLLLAEVRMVAK